MAANNSIEPTPSARPDSGLEHHIFAGALMIGAVVLVSYRSLPDHAETAKREIGRLIATVQAVEPDCGGITMLQDASDETRFTLIEYWPSREIFLGPHMQQPHIQSFIQSAGEFLAGPPDISFWHPVGGVQLTIRADAFGAA